MNRKKNAEKANNETEKYEVKQTRNLEDLCGNSGDKSYLNNCKGNFYTVYTKRNKRKNPQIP